MSKPLPLNGSKSSNAASAMTPAAGPRVHRAYCFAGQPAGCPGYFADDVLPCVCGVDGTVLEALSRIAVPAAPPASDEPAKPHVTPLSA